MSPPSFSSFPPSFSSFPELDPGPSKRASNDSDPSSSRDRKERDRYKSGRDKQKKSKRDKDHKSRKHANLLENDQRSKVRDDMTLVEQKHGSSKPVYFSDRKGDPLNVMYGGLHAGDIPKYHLVDRGRKVLGLSSAWTAFSRSRKGVEIGPNGRRKIASLTDSKSRALLALPPRRRIVNPSYSRNYEEIDGFIRLSTRNGHENLESSYRSISLGKDDSEKIDSSSSDSENEGDESSDSDDEGPTMTSLQITIKSLEQDLASNPTSISNWLSLLSHTLSTIPITSKNATKARSEITLSLLSRALGAHPENSASTILRIKYLKAGEEVWHESKVRAEWEDALKLGRPGLWMEWLEWRIRKGSKGITGLLDDAKRALNALGSKEQGDLAKIRVFWRVAVELRHAGFTERATALFQAQSELTFEVPQDLHGFPQGRLLGLLEEFWESEAPRIGEVGAKGWSSWLASGKKEHNKSSASSSVDGTHPKSSDPYVQWSEQELESDKRSLLPSRSYDAVAESDPYVTILFSDIRDLLLDLKSERAKHAFRLAWLSFLGLHIPGFATSLAFNDDLDSWDDRWSYTHLTSPGVLNTIFPSESTQNPLLADSVAGVLIGRTKEYTSVFGPVKSWSYGVLGPLDIGLVFAQHSFWSKADLESVDVGLVRRVFEQLRLSSADHEWDTMALAFEFAIDPKTAVKLSRSFLSRAQDSMRHWAAHAKLDRLRGKLDDARKVYHTVLIASSSLPLAKTKQGQLWWDWAEMEWIARREEEATQVIVKAAGAEGQGGLSILRAKRLLEDIIRLTGDENVDWKDREAWIQLRALLELLSGGPVTALDVFDQHMPNPSLKSAARESLAVASILMIYRHGVVLRNPMPPALLRERAKTTLDSCGSNSVIIAMFLEGEKGQGVWGRVRSILGEVAAGDGQWTEKDVARRVEEVWIAGWERGRWLGEIQRTRRGLAAAVESERTRASYVIWRIYIEFEIRVGQLERAKNLLYRAISECPLVKELYLLAFGPLRKVFTARELNSFADTMAEREIRMRSGLDEMLEGWKGHSSGESDDEESEMDEIEHGAQEFRRLLPY